MNNYGTTTDNYRRTDHVHPLTSRFENTTIKSESTTEARNKSELILMGGEEREKKWPEREGGYDRGERRK